MCPVPELSTPEKNKNLSEKKVRMPTGSKEFKRGQGRIIWLRTYIKNRRGRNSAHRNGFKVKVEVGSVFCREELGRWLNFWKRRGEASLRKAR